ncbi:MAG TPA: EAL domain-containing protein [Longimicrobium sp.]
MRPADAAIYRRLATLAALATPVFGWIHHRAFPQGFDPPWQRVALMLACAAVVLASYRFPRKMTAVVYTAFYGYTAWVLQLVARNGLYPDYAIGAMVVIAAVSVGFLDARHLRLYLGLTLAAVAAIGIAVPTGSALHVSGLLYVSYLVLFCLLAYVTLRGRLRAEESLAASRTRYALAARGANDGLWDWNLARGRVYFSPRWKEMLGIGEDEALDRPEHWLERLHEADRERVRAELKLHLDGQEAHFESEYRILHRDGEYRWMLARGIAVRDGAGQAERMAGSQTDITARKAAEERLLRDALTDALTGLPNRAVFLDRLQQALNRRERSGLAVLFVDLDRFKVINDSLGRAAGDALVREVGARLRAAAGDADTVARLGADQFAVLLAGVREGDATRFAARLQAEVAAPMVLAGREVVTTASVGVALGPAGYRQAEDLLRDADLATYRAKAHGPARVELFDREVHARTLDRLELETDLRVAADRGELRLHYQPIVALGDEHLTGFEALVRWQHPQRGLLPPLEFIPLAEETGLIHEIGRWVLREACRQAGEWRRALPAAPPFSVSVNVSARQLAQPDLVANVAHALADAGLEPPSLRLELTESALLADPDAALDVLLALQAVGVRLDLDDFGTGYSSFRYLHRFPIDAVKIDRSFVRGVNQDARNAAIMRTLVVLAETLGMQVVAEGIETPEEMFQVRGIRCGLGQGFYFSTPLDADAAAQALEGEITKARAYETA